MASVPGIRPAADPSSTPVLLSPGVQIAINLTFAPGPQLTWDAYWRSVYNEANAALQSQANTLMTRGNITAAEARFLVESQRNVLVTELRSNLSPFGKLYSEVLKPISKLPTLETLVQQKGSIEAVLASVGKTRSVVNRFAVVSKVAGPALIVLSITLTAAVVWSAPPEERARIIAREVGSAGGGIGGYALGSWAGCATAATLLAPSLLVPIWGEGVEGTACVVGGVLGGLGIGTGGATLGGAAAEKIYDFVTTISWTTL